MCWTDIAFATDTIGTEQKSKATAYRHSIGWTFGPVAVGALLVYLGRKSDNRKLGIMAGATFGFAGMVVGPSMGHVYAERPRPHRGALIRGVAFGVGGLAGAWYALKNFDRSSDDMDLFVAAGLTLIGSGIATASAFYDFSTTGRSVDAYNTRHSLHSLTIQPLYLARYRTLGIGVQLNF